MEAILDRDYGLSKGAERREDQNRQREPDGRPGAVPPHDEQARAELKALAVRLDLLEKTVAGVLGKINPRSIKTKIDYFEA